MEGQAREAQADVIVENTRKQVKVLGDLSAQLAEGLSSLRTRMRSAGRVTRRWQEIDTECRRFAEAYRDHESRENQLIHEAWSVDVGSVD